MEFDEIIDSVAIAFGASKNRSYRESALARVRSLVRFLQQNELVRRTILEDGQEPTETTEVLRSHLTDEGYQLVQAGYSKWLRALDRGRPPEDTSILANALSKMRSPKADAGHEQSLARGARSAGPKSNAGGSNTTVARPKSASQRGSKKRKPSNCARRPKPGERLMEEFEAAGPHVYDKADWHVEGEFPDDLPDEQANVHTGMFVGWLIEKDMIIDEFLEEAERFKRKEITGAQAYEIWGGCLASDMLTEEGNCFAREYYGEKFAADYQELLVRDLPSFYHVADTWQNYGIIRKRIEARYAATRASKLPGS